MTRLLDALGHIITALVAIVLLTVFYAVALRAGFYPEEGWQNN